MSQLVNEISYLFNKDEITIFNIINYIRIISFKIDLFYHKLFIFNR